MAWVEAVEVQGMAKAPEAPDAPRCPRGFWRVACTCVYGEQGGPWWRWTTGCSHLDRTEDTSEGEVMKQSKPDRRRQMGWEEITYCMILLYIKHISPLFMTAYVALYVSE